jgi:ABC-type amino acid transport substrate-binding protein
MGKLRTRTVLSVATVVALGFSTVACSSDGGSGSIKSLKDLKDKTIGVQSSTTGETYAKAHKPSGAKVKAFSDTTDLFGALESGDIDAILQDLPVNAGRATKDSSVAVVETYKTDEQYGFAVEKGSPLKAQLDKALKDVRADGTYDALYGKYFPKNGAKAGKGPKASTAKGTDTLKVCSDIPYAPMEFEGKGPRGLKYTGFDIELLDAMAATMDAKLDVIDSDFDGILGNLAAGTCDVVGSSLTITPERAKEVDFTTAYFDADQSLLVKAG